MAPPSSAAPPPPAVDWRLLDVLERAFAAHAGAHATLDVASLQRALGLRSGYLAKRMLTLLDLDGDGVVRHDEFLEGVRKLVFGTPREKLEFAFRLHDHDGDGTLERDELRRMVAISLAEDDATTRPEQVDRLVQLLFASADANRDGRLSFDEFSAAVHAHPVLLRQMTRSEARWFVPGEDLLDRALAPTPSWTARLGRALQNRRLPALVLFLWLAANVVLFVSGMLSVVGHGTPRSEPFWMLSKACTQCLQFNAGLVVLPVLRRLLTWVRGTRFARIVPVDQAIDFHRYVGTALFVFAVGHVFAAIADYAATGPLLQRLTSTRALTGLAWFAVFAFLWSFSRTSVRRSGSFELFYFSHLLYVAWFAIGMIHAPGLALIAGVPLLALGIELLVRRRHRSRPVKIVSGEALRSGVTRLEIARPAGFAAKPGDWVFLCIPALAKHEWHPFTLSSAPEQDTLTVHVRSLGNWTSALRHRFETQRPGEPHELLEARIDGPHGSPSGALFDTRVPVLIGAGIGVTPFASVLQSLLLRHRAGQSKAAFERGYFYWLNRDQYSFEWFRSLLEDLEKKDTEHLLSVNLWMTGGRAGATALGLELGRELLHEAGEADPLSGTRTKVEVGHPDWEAELARIQRDHPAGAVAVFFCGPAGLARKVRYTCAKLGLPFREERF